MKTKELAVLKIDLEADINILEEDNEKAKREGLAFPQIDRALSLLKETLALVKVKIEYGKD